MHFMSLNIPKKFLIIPEAGIATKCVVCGAECPPAGRMNVPGKGKGNLKIEVEALKMGIVLLTNCLYQTLAKQITIL